jgi:assimilatory nitrate reductase catalytic subunit
VEINEVAAQPRGIADGDWVTVRTRRGELTAPALVVKSIRPDTLFIPYHYGHDQAANILTNPVLEPMNKIPEYKVCAAAIALAKEKPEWAKDVNMAQWRAARGRRRRLPSVGEPQGPAMG